MYIRILLWLLPTLGYWRFANADCNRIGQLSLCHEFDGVQYINCPTNPGRGGRVIEQIPISCGVDVDNVFTSSSPEDALEFVGTTDMKYFYISELSIPEGVMVTIGRVSCFGECNIIKLSHQAEAPLVFQRNGRKFRIRASGPGVVLKFQCNLPDRECKKAPMMHYTKRMLYSIEATPHEFPFMGRVRLFYTLNENPNEFRACNAGGYVSDDDTQNSQQCADGQEMKTMEVGGSIIHKNWILTVAHKYKPRRRIDNVAGFNLMGALVIVGDHLRSGPDPEREMRWVSRQNIFTHPDFDTPTRFNNDIGLLKVDRPITLNEDSRFPICLPPSYMKDVDLSYSEVQLAGWGVDSTATPTEELNKETFYVIDNNDCSAVYSQYASAAVTDEMVCTENSQAHPCHGDGGGPAFCQSADGFYMEIGIISWQSTSLTQIWKVHEPNVCTRVTEFLPWIRNRMAPDLLP